MSINDVVQRVLTWLRAGYPAGVPQQDYVALLGILHRTLTEEEVLTVAKQLGQDSGREITDDEVREGIRQFIHEEASESDLNRVRGVLASSGWPLATQAPAGQE